MSWLSCCIARGDQCLGRAGESLAAGSEGVAPPPASEVPSGNSLLATARPCLCSDLSGFSASRAQHSHCWWDPRVWLWGDCCSPPCLLLKGLIGGGLLFQRQGLLSFVSD